MLCDPFTLHNENDMSRGFLFFFVYLSFHKNHIFDKVTYYKTTFRHAISTRKLFFGMEMEMSLLRQIFGICTTQLPGDDDCWRYSKERIKIEWTRVPELHKPAGEICLEGKGLPIRVLVVYGMDGQYHAFRNRSTFMGRRLDPVASKQTVRSCNLFRSVFDYTGNVMSGPAKEPLKTFQVETKHCKVIIWL